MRERPPGAVQRRRVLRGRSRRLLAEPQSAYELLTRHMVEQLGRDLADLRRRVDQLFTTVVGAIVLELLVRLWG